MHRAGRLEVGATDRAAPRVTRRASYVALTFVVAAAAAVTTKAPHGTSWHFFDDGARLLLGAPVPGLKGPGRLHVYRSHPEFQFGPLALGVATFLHAIAGAHSAAVAQFLLMPVPLGLVWLLDDAARRLGGPAPRPVVLLAGGGALVVAWVSLALFTTHLDDALALAAVVGAINLITRARVTATAVVLGLAAAAKPWAIVFVPLVFALPRDRWRAAVTAVAVAVIGWVPFVLADHATIGALSHFTIRNSPVSALRALEVETPRTPAWDRLAQLFVGGAVVTGTVVPRRSRWPAALLAGIAARLALDPGAHHYYTAGLVTGGLAWDLISSPFGGPIGSIAAIVLLEVPRRVVSPELAGTLRLATMMAAVALAVAGPRRGRNPRAPSRSAPPPGPPAPVMGDAEALVVQAGHRGDVERRQLPDDPLEEVVGEVGVGDEHGTVEVRADHAVGDHALAVETIAVADPRRDPRQRLAVVDEACHPGMVLEAGETADAGEHRVGHDVADGTVWEHADGGAREQAGTGVGRTVAVDDSLAEHL
jgi:hypothetical protein